MNICKTIPGSHSGKRFRVIALSLFAAILFVVPSYGQGGTVNGTVRDASGEPMIGVSVVVKGTSTGTSTEIDGTFSLRNAGNNAVLVFSYLGYATQEVAVSGQTYFDITMLEDINHLEEVIVVGYGSLTKKELSSSIVQVNKEEFHQGSVNSPMELIAGKIPGVSVSNTSIGDPNSSAGVQIRGVGSIRGSQSPLYIIDGIAGADIRSISPQDIVSMTVLKDAASAAIYGSRSANGVILITTKRGSGPVGSQSVTYDSWFSVNTVSEKIDILSADEFRRSMRRNDYGASTDWYDALIRDFSYTHNQYLSFDGVLQKSAYSASLNYRQGTGLDIASGRKEYGGRFSVSQKFLEDILEFSGSLNLRKVQETWGDNGMFGTASTLNPTMPIYNEDGSYYHPTSPLYIRNPVETMLAEKRGGERIYGTGNIEMKANILRTANHNLSATANFALDYNDLNRHFFSPTTSAASELWNEYEGEVSIQYEKWWTTQFEWFLNYTFEKNDHLVRAVAGYSWVQNDNEGHRLNNSGFDYDQFLWHAIGTGSALQDGKAGMGSWKGRDRQIGMFGRVNYSWRNIIMASASFRREGNTKFGANHKWGNFPGVSVAAELANTSWMSDYRDVVNSLKLRVSYGTTGRSYGDRGLSLSTYQAISPDSNRGWRYLIDGVWVQAFGPGINPNPDLKWETAVYTNIGVDFALWNRLRGSVEWFDKQSKDLLYTYSVPQPPFIYDNMLVNVGTISVKGLELNLEADIFNRKDFRWTTGVIFSTQKPVLKKLSDATYVATSLSLYRLPGIGTSEHLFNVTEGGRIGDFWGYEHAGIDENGNLLIYDNDGNMIPKTAAHEDYKRVIGNGSAKFFYSWSNSFQYKDFDLNFFFRGAAGHDIFNMRKYEMGMQSCGADNVLREAYLKNRDVTQDASIISSYYIEKGDYITLENITLGYTLPIKNKRFVDNLRVYVSAKNLFTITGYSGNNPNTVTINGLEPGVDTNGAYPYARQFSLGITMRFK